MKEKSYKILTGPESVQGSPEWLEFRKGKIGASMAPIIMGVSPWKTRLELWEDIIFDRANKVTDAMKRGTDLEEKAREDLNKDASWNFKPSVIQSIQYPSIFASLDGYSEDRDGTAFICEIKCPNRHTHQEALEGNIPPHYWPQLQHQMMVCNVPQMIYFSFDGLHGTIVVCEKDDKYCEKLLKEELSFLDSIINFKPPSPTPKDWVENSDPELIVKSFRYKQLSLLIDELEIEREEIRKKLIENQEHPRVAIGDLRLQKITSKGKIDYEKILEDYQISDQEKYRKKPTESWRINANH